MNMNILQRRLAVGAIRFAGFLAVAGCASREEVTAVQPTPQVIVQPAPVVMAPPPPRVVTEKTTTERSVNDAVDNAGPDMTQQRSSSYHSETTTVTPAPPPPPVDETTTTTYQKKTYQSNY